MKQVAFFKSNNRHCAGENLSAYIDGMLDGETMREIAGHLRECVDCRRLYEGLSQTKTLLRTVSAPSTPPQADFWAETFRHARLQAPAPRRLPSWNWSALKYRWSIATAAAGVVLAAAIIAFSPLAGGNGSHPTVQIQPVGPTLDISKVVGAHAEYAAQQPLADDSRLSTVLSDAAQSDDVSSGADSDDALNLQTDTASGATDLSGAEAVGNAAGQID
jgi:predicted anti-sigma-YlaC factor YlaD